MTAVVEIRCPGCGALDAVYKVGVGRYRCGNCDRRFEAADLVERVD